MTADDVRAKFEAWIARQGASIHRDGPYYTSTYTQGAWSGYRAAHADLSGEVRESVSEVIREAEKHERLYHTSPAMIGFIATELSKRLAKFTQEKP